MFIRYFFISFTSVLLTIIFFYFSLTTNIFGESFIYSPQDKKYINEDKNENNPYIYKDSYYAYKNWKVKVGNSENFRIGSTIAVTNVKNPITLTMTDNDLNHMVNLSISQKNSDKGSVTCNANRVHVFFNSNNDIDGISLYDGNLKNGYPQYRVKIKRKNGQWEIVERAEANCL
ncbi:hypothetical protein LVJ85_10670 [Neisseria sp. Dent CA1/247]|uniref:hypothetical protein n=1 Tax=Neisseria sp. Dent CA1/247 TaxID=2912675 RepID=UPI001FD1C90E|nr:hypothetical protein [Neisseria sp. Dent CA1/247]UOO76464.1 hypothetical protein LVJ85_10670 [Neisseria sp. Dent CA1/247]